MALYFATHVATWALYLTVGRLRTFWDLVGAVYTPYQQVAALFIAPVYAASHVKALAPYILPNWVIDLLQKLRRR